jgi:deoxyribose-phosphate aldolase
LKRTNEPVSVPPIDSARLEERATAIGKLATDNTATRADLDRILRSIDLTTLEGSDTPERIRDLCRKAMQPDPDQDAPPVAAICVFPNFVELARNALEGSTVRVVSVAGAFPSGQSFLDLRLEEIRRAVAAGADEVDVVMNRGAFLAGEFARVHDELAAAKDAARPARLKVILETGELGGYDPVRHASQIALDAGADMIKTSTGKIARGATPPVALVMLEALRDHHRATGRAAGLKVAGGVRTAELAFHYLVLVRELLGEAWLEPDRFRIGASALLDDVLAHRRKLPIGR